MKPPPAVKGCLEDAIGPDIIRQIIAGELLPNPDIGDHMQRCFGENFPAPGEFGPGDFPEGFDHGEFPEGVPEEFQGEFDQQFQEQFQQEYERQYLEQIQNFQEGELPFEQFQIPEGFIPPEFQQFIPPEDIPDEFISPPVEESPLPPSEGTGSVFNAFQIFLNLLGL